MAFCRTLIESHSLGVQDRAVLVGHIYVHTFCVHPTTWLWFPVTPVTGTWAYESPRPTAPVQVLVNGSQSMPQAPEPFSQLAWSSWSDAFSPLSLAPPQTISVLLFPTLGSSPKHPIVSRVQFQDALPLHPTSEVTQRASPIAPWGGCHSQTMGSRVLGHP